MTEMSEPTREQMATQVRYLEAEVTDLRRRLDDVPGQSRGLESRLADAQRSLAAQPDMDIDTYIAGKSAVLQQVLEASGALSDEELAAIRRLNEA